MSSRPRLGRWAVASLIVTALASSKSSATVLDLTSPGAHADSQGALFFQADPQPTGTGVIQPFVRIQRTGTERGYNTDARPVEFDTKDQNQWTHSLSLASLSPVSINGTAYYQFLLDVNESGSDTKRLLSMNDFRVYLGDSPSLTGWNDGFGTHSVKVYDLDAAGNSRVELDYKLNSGSGSGDMFVFIPVSKFQGYAAQYQYVYLYSAFGQPHGSDAGFEEWAAKTSSSISPPPGGGGGSAVPAPPGLVLAGMGFGCLLLGRLRFRRDTPKA